KIDGGYANQPRAFASMQPKEKQERYQREKSVHPIKFVDNAGAQHAQLGDEPQRFVKNIGWIGFFVLTPSESMDEPLHGPGITPFHRWIGHAGQRHIKIEGGSGNPAETTSNDHEPFPAELAGSDGAFNNQGQCAKGKQEKQRSQDETE